jgi:hypothetical protein
VEEGGELPVGTGRGYLWRQNTYWLLDPRPEGVYVECRSLSLTAKGPMGLRWAINIVADDLPAEALENTLKATARAVRNRSESRLPRPAQNVQ